MIYFVHIYSECDHQLASKCRGRGEDLQSNSQELCVVHACVLMCVVCVYSVVCLLLLHTGLHRKSVFGY